MGKIIGNGDDDDAEIRFVESANGRRGKEENTKTAGMIQIADLLCDSAVAIKENAGTQGRLIRHAAPLSRRATALQPPQPSRPLFPSCNDDRLGIGGENKDCSRVFVERCCSAA